MGIRFQATPVAIRRLLIKLYVRVKVPYLLPLPWIRRRQLRAQSKIVGRSLFIAIKLLDLPHEKVHLVVFGIKGDDLHRLLLALGEIPVDEELHGLLLEGFHLLGGSRIFGALCLGLLIQLDKLLVIELLVRVAGTESLLQHILL